MMTVIVNPGRLHLLRAVLVCSLVSTAVHYSHNLIYADDYPPVWFLGETFFEVGVIVVWPTLTAIGLWGYLRYRAGDVSRARPALIAYSFTGTTSILHFLGGSPDIPPLFYATIFTDFLAGLAVLAVALSLPTPAPPAAPAPRRAAAS